MRTRGILVTSFSTIQLASARSGTCSRAASVCRPCHTVWSACRVVASFLFLVHPAAAAGPRPPLRVRPWQEPQSSRTMLTSTACPRSSGCGARGCLGLGGRCRGRKQQCQRRINSRGAETFPQLQRLRSFPGVRPAAIRGRMPGLSKVRCQDSPGKRRSDSGRPSCSNNTEWLVRFSLLTHLTVAPALIWIFCGVNCILLMLTSATSAACASAQAECNGSQKRFQRVLQCQRSFFHCPLRNYKQDCPRKQRAEST